LFPWRLPLGLVHYFGTTNLNIGTGAGNGTVTYTNLEIECRRHKQAIDRQCVWFASALSAVFNVNSPPTISNIPNLTTNEDKVATSSFTIQRSGNTG